MEQVRAALKTLEPSLLKLPTDFSRPVSSEQQQQDTSCTGTDIYATTSTLSLSQQQQTEGLSTWTSLLSIILARYTGEENFVVGQVSLLGDSFTLVPIQLSTNTQYIDLYSNISQNKIPSISVSEYTSDATMSNTVQVTIGDCSSIEVISKIGNIDIHISIVNGVLSVIYRQDLFLIARVEEIARQLVHLHDQLVQKGQSTLIYDFSLVTPHYASILPNPAAELDNKWEGSVVSYLEMHARNTPDRICMVDARESITFSQLNTVANQLSRRLIQMGLKKSDIVAIFGHRSMPIVHSIASVLKVGASFTIIDPAYPADRIIECLKVATPRAVIVIEQVAHMIPKSVEEFIQQEGLLVALVNKTSTMINELAEIDGSDLNIEISPDDVAVVTFTSGSTGIPKGVLGRHGPLTHYYPWMKSTFGFTSEEHFSMQSGISHDPLQRDIFTPWYLGAKIYIPDAEDIVNPGRLAEWFQENAITISHLTPAMGQLLTSAAANSVVLNSLKYAYFVGDVLTRKFVKRMSTIAPQCSVINLYGSTETQRSVTYYLVPKPSDPAFKLLKDILPIGKGMRDVQALIFSRNSTNPYQLAGLGEMGEIYMRSPHLSLGYKGKQKETDEKFLPNPSSTDRMYRTGDLGRYLPTGDAECSGRADDQIKIRGFRIELGEINTAVVSHDYIKESVTIVRTDLVPDEKRLVSYFVFDHIELAKHSIHVDRRTLPTLIRDLRRHLRSKIPEYMIPSVFMPLDHIPLTPNGKIKHAALPRPRIETEVESDSDTDDDDEGFVAPSGKLEEQLAKIWSTVIGIKRIGVHDNFFDLGGHSISATNLTLKIRQQVSGAENLPVEVLFQAPTIRAMAVAIDKLRSGTMDTSKRVRTKTSDVNIRDLFGDTHLDPSIKPTEMNMIDHDDKWYNPEHILLTGCTGFLGSFILGDLLRYTEAKIYCMVRANDADDALARIEQSLASHITMWEREDVENRLDSKQVISRIVPLKGDLSASYLGLTEESFNQLADTIDVIIHNGALVHWMYPYEKLKAANVSGTTEILRLACRGKRLAAVHYVSTTSVFDSDSYSKWTDVLEDCDLPYHEDLKGGYAQSKYVAERLIMNAKRRGVPACIYRPGYITGHSTTGVWNPDDFLCRLIKGCIQMKCYPDLPTSKLDMSPVNFVSGAITYLFKTRKALRLYQAFHLVNPTEFFFNSLFETAQRLGYKMEAIPYSEWKAKLYSYDGEEENALYPMITHFSDDYEQRMTQKRPWYDNQNTLTALEGTGITCPAIVNLMGTYYKFLCQCGFLPLPEKPTPLAVKMGFTQQGIKLAAPQGTLSRGADFNNSHDENPAAQEASLIKSLMRNNKL